MFMYASWTPPTLITSLAAQHTIEWAKARGWRPVEMVGIGANRLRFLRAMRWLQADTQPPHLLVYMGHGFPGSWLGNDFPPSPHKPKMLAAGQNDHLLEGAICWSIACYSRRVLGPSAIDKGALAFGGSVEQMLVGGFERHRCFVPDFADTFSIAVKALLAGRTVDEALRAQQDRIRYYLGIYARHLDWPGVKDYIDAMRMNLAHYDAIGDLNTRLY